MFIVLARLLQVDIEVPLELVQLFVNKNYFHLPLEKLKKYCKHTSVLL